MRLVRRTRTRTENPVDRCLQLAADGRSVCDSNRICTIWFQMQHKLSLRALDVVSQYGLRLLGVQV